MMLDKTIILPADNSELSKKLLTSTLQNEQVIAIIIFGKDARAEDAANNANQRARKPVSGIERKVIWMQDPSNLMDFLKTLIKNGQGMNMNDIDLNKHIGIAVSISEILKDLIPSTPAPDSLKMETVFMKASTL
jgi:hypothetical protein